MSNLIKSQSTSPIDQVRNDLNKMMPQFQMALPQNVTPEKFIRVAITALQNNPELLSCDRQSLYSSAMKAAADGLLPDGREAAFVKYGNKIQYLPMIGGLYKKIRNSGEIASLTSQIVYRNDKFRYWVDSDGEHLEHEPLLFGGDRGERIGVYAIAKLKDGGVEIEPMTEADVMAIKKVSKSSSSGPWSGPFESEMWRKTAIRRLSKRLPMNADLQQVIERDDELHDIHIAQPLNKIEELQAKIKSAPIPQVESEPDPVIEEVKEKDPESFANFQADPKLVK